ncbi:hypothetical protein CCR97_18865 [Rhodoplanes elegans]|uniref:Transposase n=1 Tax=Rhodoplanes elegans TaxID=29408 RepID=A0A327KW95_9BRAD|nr:helix-turn-helix domain-containing protein [Rhodoplanes elegans]MBK5960246.1 hypothetical protein [Rhodoplanes elegans]RAI42274.1 hypothetical protein CH338_00550 [Rhodoplanes elegans]
MVGRRHGNHEIAEKLAEAGELAARGKNQHEIAKALGISVMTYHRWRKQYDTERDEPSTETARSVRSDETATATGPSYSPSSGPRERTRDVRELEQENLRLRRLVTDLLLEKMALEDELDRGPRDRARQVRAR